MVLTWDRLLQLQAELRAEDVALSPSMLEWDERRAIHYFQHPDEVGGFDAASAAAASAAHDWLLVAPRIWDGLSDVCMQAAAGDS
eukprot:4446317-Prymnesium_polylepis.1